MSKDNYISNQILRSFTPARSRGILLILALVSSPGILHGATVSIDLGAASGFAVLGGAAVTVTGTTVVGDIGSSPTPAITLTNAILDGTNHAGDAVTLAAKTDLVAAYTDAAGRAYNVQYIDAFDLHGLTLKSGVYNSPSSLFLTGSLILDAQGNSDAVWIFQAGSTLITMSDSSVTLIGGARASNIFWQVGSSATLGTDSNFAGSILALTSITVNTGTTVAGRVLANHGAVTLNSSAITVSEGLPPAPAQAVDVHWNGSGSSWNKLNSWSTTNETSTSNPTIMAGSTERASFNTSALGTTQIIDMDAAQSLLGLSFNSPGTVLIQAGGEDQILTIAAGGISKTGSGLVTIGSTTGGQQVSLQLGANQSWTNHDCTSALHILNSVSPSFATERTLTLDGTSTAANTIAGVVSDNGVGVMTLNKTGTGTWILSGENTYTGDTTISAGKLRINGSTSSKSNFRVTTGGSLNGSGTVGGNTLINSGGALAPGNSSGVLTISGNTHFESDSIFEWKIDTAQGNPETNRGIAYDGVNTTFISGSGAIFKIMLTGTQDFTDPFWTQTRIWTDIFKSSDGQSNLADWSSAFSGGFQYAYNGQTVAPTSTGSFSVNGNSLTWSAVPEPSNLLVWLVAASALLSRRRQG